jgi:transposase-like protein
MAKKNDKSLILSALRRACGDERSAVEFMETRRWPGGATCPYCTGKDVYQMKDRKTGERNKDHRWRCRQCNQMFTVRTGTIMEETRLPVRVWCFAFWKACASKKGVSALQISRECEISYKSALFLMHRVRHAMSDGEPGPALLTGDVEADETYVGGKANNRKRSKSGFRKHDKACVLGMVQRGGDLRLHYPKNLTLGAIKGQLIKHISIKARFMTDSSSPYKTIGQRFIGGHETVNHTAKEYARGDVTTNTIEGAFSLLKRGIYGTFHSVSKEKLQLYLNEFQFRYNHRKADDGERTEAAIASSVGKRLRYADHVSRKAS